MLCPGKLLGEVVKNMKDKRDGKMSLQQKAFIYSAVCTLTVLALICLLIIFASVNVILMTLFT